MREEIESLLLIRQRLAGEIGFVKSRPGDHLSRPVGEEDEEPRGLAPQYVVLLRTLASNNTAKLQGRQSITVMFTFCATENHEVEHEEGRDKQVSIQTKLDLG